MMLHALAMALALVSTALVQLAGARLAQEAATSSDFLAQLVLLEARSEASALSPHIVLTGHLDLRDERKDGMEVNVYGVLDDAVRYGRLQSLRVRTSTKQDYRWAVP
jgi:hypothetical protein